MPQEKSANGFKEKKICIFRAILTPIPSIRFFHSNHACIFITAKFEFSTHSEFPIWICIDKWVIEGIGIPVETIGISSKLNIWIWTQESTKDRIIYPPIHVDQVEDSQMLMARKPSASK